MKIENTINGAIFDIDGTLAMMDETKRTFKALPGAIEALDKFRSAGIPVVAYTNGTFFPPAHYYPLLADAGLVIEPGFIVTPASVAAHYFSVQGYKRIMVLGESGTQVPMEEAGFDVVEPAAGQDPVEAVMIGWTRHFGLPELEALCEAVWAGALPFTASDAPFFASSKGRMLGVSSAIAAMIGHVTGQQAVVLGKPSTLGMDMAANLMQLSPSQIVVIGDDPKLEIAMARKSGAHTVGVTTGISDAAAFEKIAPDLHAHTVLSTLEDLPINQWIANRAA